MQKIIFGYQFNENYEVILNQENASTIRIIFELYLSGKSLGGIADELMQRKILTPSKKTKWSRASIDKILENIVYASDIVSPELFVKVQKEKARRTNKEYTDGSKKRRSTRYNGNNVLSGLLVCSECNHNYRRITKSSGEIVWRCANRVEHGSAYCQHSSTVTDMELKSFICKALKINEYVDVVVKEKIDRIEVLNDKTFRLIFKSNFTKITA